MRRIILLAFTAASLMAADATGTWTGTFTPSSDNSDKPALLILKQDGATLTGSAGPDANERHPIQNGKVENGTLTFEVSSGGGIMKFTLKIEGDEIKGQIVREREGQTETARIAVKRDK